MASTGFQSLLNLNHHNSSSYWATIDAEIDENLKKSIAKIRSSNLVIDPMHQLTFAATRTTAPGLCIAACELVGGRRGQAVAAASALRLMHSAAQAHEPLIGRSPTPWGPPTPTQQVFGPNIALLTGDGMVPFGFELLAQSCDEGHTEPHRVLRVMTEIARVIGSQGIVAGQYHEMHSCGAACGAILGGGKEEEVERLREYGKYLGILTMMLKTKEKWEQIERTREIALKELDIFPLSSDHAQNMANLVIELEGTISSI